MISKKKILDVEITDATKREVLEYIVKNLESFKKKFFIVTPNPEFLVLANKDYRFKTILNNAELALADGVGLLWAGKIMGKSLKARYAGVDLVKNLCEMVAEKPITVGFLGGRQNVAELTAECLVKKYPKLKVAFVGEEWINEGRMARQPLVSDDVRQFSRGPVVGFPHASARSQQSHVRAVGNPSSHATPSQSKFINPKSYLLNHESIDILFVAFGAPKQEFWIEENLSKIPVKVAIGVGGAFDYLSGKVPRAPKFLRSIGLEWLFRLVVQPWRIKRQLSLLKFVYLVMKERIS